MNKQLGTESYPIYLTTENPFNISDIINPTLGSIIKITNKHIDLSHVLAFEVNFGWDYGIKLNSSDEKYIIGISFDMMFHDKPINILIHVNSMSGNYGLVKMEYDSIKQQIENKLSYYINEFKIKH